MLDSSSELEGVETLTIPSLNIGALLFIIERRYIILCDLIFSDFRLANMLYMYTAIVHMEGRLFSRILS